MSTVDDDVTTGTHVASFEETVAHARSVLAVPGHLADRFGEVAGSGADVVMLDLEDHVAPDAKPAARRNIAEWLDAGGNAVVRVNGAGTSWCDDDLAMLAGRRCVVLLPKVDTAAQVERAVDALGDGSSVIPALETAAGILSAREICSARGVLRAIFGNGDLAAELGIELDDRVALRHARSQVVLASAAAGVVPPIDGVTTVLEDELLLADVRDSRALGFTGKTCVHPSQVAVVNEGFAPDRDQVEWAREVLASAGDGSIRKVRNRIVSKPMVEHARRLVAHAARAGGRQAERMPDSGSARPAGRRR